MINQILNFYPLGSTQRIFLITAVLLPTLGACVTPSERSDGAKTTLSELNKCTKISNVQTTKAIENVILDDSGKSDNALTTISSVLKVAHSANKRLDVLLNCFLGPTELTSAIHAAIAQSAKAAGQTAVDKLAAAQASTEAQQSARETAEILASRRQYFKHYAAILNGSKAHQEFRLLRGHIITTLLSRYGTFNHTGRLGGDAGKVDLYRSSGGAQDAADTLASISDAEYELRRGSSLFERSSDPKSGKLILPYSLSEVTKTANINFKMGAVDAAYGLTYRVRRVTAIAELFKDSAEPTVKRGARFIRTFVSVVRSPNIGGIRQLFNIARAAIKKMALLDLFSVAYIDDSRRFIKSSFAKLKSQNGMPTKDYWLYWDLILEEGCARFKSDFGSKADCTPGNYK